MPGTPSDWVSGERVFAPPRGTVDVDWLVPAVLELAPGTTPARARAALERAWLERRAAAAGGHQPAAGSHQPVAGTVAAPAPAATATDDRDGEGPAGDDALSGAAERVVVEALDTFGG